LEIQLLIIAWIIAACLLGIIGAVLGSTVDKGWSGWWLGFLVGPIGWIIVLLLPREQQRRSDPAFRNSADDHKPIPNVWTGERNLFDDSYKIWLVKTHGIERNEALGQLICNDRLFQTIEEALEFADSIEEERQSKKNQERERITPIMRQQQTREDTYTIVIGSVLMVAILIGALLLARFFAGTS
jgi:hypothetical protein